VETKLEGMMNESVCLVPLNGRFEFVEQALKRHFHVVNATSLQQLQR